MYYIFKIKSIGTITLNDFKEYVKLKHGSSYIYHFKAQDPEFGIVKEVFILLSTQYYSALIILFFTRKFQVAINYYPHLKIELLHGSMK
jgi:hypothetical protein